MRYTCKNCGCELPDDAQFCTRCGTKVSAPRCPGCGRILPEDAAFCTFCSTRLTPEETRTESTPEKGVAPLPESPTVELKPASPESLPEPASSPAALPTQQACPPESVPLPPNVPSDAAQPPAGEQAVPSASGPTEEKNPDSASGGAGDAPSVPALDIPALPADAEPPASLRDG